MTHETPNPVKRRYSALERLLSPKSSIVGLVLIVLGIFVLQMDIDKTVANGTSVVLIGAGLVGLGLKDKK